MSSSRVAAGDWVSRISRRLACTGYRVIAIARREGDDLAAAIREQARSELGSLCFRPFDLSDVAGIPDLVKRLRSEFGSIYGLVNNAAASATGPLTLTSDIQIERLVRLNVTSPLTLTRHIVRAMISDGGGRIVNVASIVSITGFSGLSVYGATKASLVGFTRSLARELGPVGINVNAVAPDSLTPI